MYKAMVIAEMQKNKQKNFLQIKKWDVMFLLTETMALRVFKYRSGYNEYV